MSPKNYRTFRFFLLILIPCLIAACSGSKEYVPVPGGGGSGGSGSGGPDQATNGGGSSKSAADSGGVGAAIQVQPDFILPRMTRYSGFGKIEVEKLSPLLGWQVTAANIAISLRRNQIDDETFITISVDTSSSPAIEPLLKSVYLLIQDDKVKMPIWESYSEQLSNEPLDSDSAYHPIAINGEPVAYIPNRAQDFSVDCNQSYTHCTFAGVPLDFAQIDATKTVRIVGDIYFDPDTQEMSLQIDLTDHRDELLERIQGEGLVAR